MTEPARQGELRAGHTLQSQGSSNGANLADILERVLDKGIVIAGDIQVNLLDIELLTIKLRLLVASVDKAKEMGIDWWEHDPSLSSRSIRSDQGGTDAVETDKTRTHELESENDELRRRIAALEGTAQQGEIPAEQATRSSHSRQRTTSTENTSRDRRPEQ